jgi:hypothetical protein
MYLEGRRVGKSYRIWIAIGAAICGVLAVVGWAVAIYAYQDTPEIHDVVVKLENGGQAIQSKGVFLFAPAVCQTFLCWMLLHPLVWSKAFARKVAKYQDKSTLSILAWSKTVSVSVSVSSGVCLYWLVVRVIYLAPQLMPQMALSPSFRGAS